MFANNEIGTIQPIKEIGEMVKAKNILFHVDAAQAVGYVPIHAYDMNIDLMSFSAHKFYGPKGIGGLFVRSFSLMVRLSPVSFGGGHERSLRPGTVNVPGVVGMAEALVVGVEMQKTENERLRQLSSVIISTVSLNFPEIRVNGHPENKLAHNLSLTVPGVEAKALIHILKDKLSFSTGPRVHQPKLSHLMCLKPSH